MLEQRQITKLRNSAIDDAPNRVRAAIELSGKTQREVAEALEMTAPYLNDICNGRVPDPKRSTMQRLANYFGCSMDDLFPSRAA